MSDTNIFASDSIEGDEINIIDDLDLKTNIGQNTTKKNGDNKQNKDFDEVVTISKSKLVLIKKLLENIKENNDHIQQLLSGSVSSIDEQRITISQGSDFETAGIKDNDTSGTIIEGVFDGENMIGPDGKQYSVPANYASKSKLIEGDIMKLTITANGTFVYKQIGPAERKRIVGVLEQDASGSFTVVSDGKKWRVLTASVTYYKGQSGDEVVVLVPQNGESNWASVDNIVRAAN